MMFLTLEKEGQSYEWGLVVSYTRMTTGSYQDRTFRTKEKGKAAENCTSKTPLPEV